MMYLGSGCWWSRETPTSSAPVASQLQKPLKIERLSGRFSKHSSRQTKGSWTGMTYMSNVKYEANFNSFIGYWVIYVRLFVYI